MTVLQMFDLFFMIIMIPCLIMMGNKDKRCYPILLIANFGVITVILCNSPPILWGLLSTQIVFIIINVRNWIKWTKDDKYL